MLTIAELDEFEKYMESGNLELDFEYGDKQRRHELLELLQKLMDVADVADEIASKIIYKGLAKPGPAKEQGENN